jgi:hypothetical protein
MPVVRDLGINAIPVLPVVVPSPESGPAAGLVRPVLACPDTTCMEVTLWRCTPPTGLPVDPPSAYYAGGFTPDAVVQLKQQLQDRIGKQLVN